MTAADRVLVGLMAHAFVPLVLLALLPLLALAATLRSPARQALHALAILFGAAALAIGIAQGGIDFKLLDRMKLVVAAAAILAVARPAPPLRRRALAAIAVFAWAIYFNFGAFHGAGSNRTYIHLHDVAHYYLGSKYFAEVGYGRLYIAMLRAEAERYENHFKSIEARDLETNGLVHIRVLLQRSEPIRRAFDAERWAAFQADVGYFREAMGVQYGDVLRDHGFNPTPVWALLGGLIANLVPAGSHRGILALTLLDPILELAMFALVGWAFGTDALLLALVHFTLPYGASFGWTGGSFLRFMWLLGVVGYFCCWRRGRPAAAGALLAWASALRIFPVLFLVVPLVGAGMHLAAERRIVPELRRLLVSFAVCTAGVIVATLFVSHGTESWGEFGRNLRRHIGSNAYNTIGLGEVLAYHGASKPDTAAAFAQDVERRRWIHRVQLATFLPAVLALIAMRARRGEQSDALIGAALCLFVAVGLASYYYAFLFLFVIFWREDRFALALVFGIELLTYMLALFEDREVVLYFYRNVLVAELLIGLVLRAWLPAGARTAAG